MVMGTAWTQRAAQRGLGRQYAPAHHGRDRSGKGCFVARLSIILPTLGTQSAIDETLVSLLENRPDGCQLLVVCAPSYQDPYDLHDEVQFVRMSAATPWTHYANTGLRHARGAHVQLIFPGIRALPGWEQTPLAMLADCPEVAAIAPRIAAGIASDQDLVGAALTADRTRQLLWSSPQAISRDTRTVTLGPARYAGYFRASALREVGGWNQQIDARVADVELTVRLRHAAWNCVAMRDRHLCSVTPLVEDHPPSFAMVRDLERISRDYASSLLSVHSAETPAAGAVTPQPPAEGLAQALVRFAGRAAGRLGRTPVPPPLDPVAPAIDLPTAMPTPTHRRRAA